MFWVFQIWWEVLYPTAVSYLRSSVTLIWNFGEVVRQTMGHSSRPVLLNRSEIPWNNQTWLRSNVLKSAVHSTPSFSTDVACLSREPLPTSAFALHCSLPISTSSSSSSSSRYRLPSFTTISEQHRSRTFNIQFICVPSHQHE